MMTQTTLSDVRRTRPRFAAPTPTPPKFLIGTIEQSENRSTPSKQTTNPNPNRYKTRFSRRPWRSADSPQRTRLWRPRAMDVSKISRPSFSLIPFAQLHPRNAVTPFPAVSLYRWPPAGVFEVLATSRPWSGLAPLAQPHPRKPSGLSQSLGFTPFAQPRQRNKTSGRDSAPFASRLPRRGSPP